jgi:hypothetical protein
VCSIFFGIAIIVEACRQLGQQAAARLDFPQQQATRVGRDRSAVESSRNLPAAEGLKFKRRLGTLCFHGAASVLLAKVVFCKTTYATPGSPFSIRVVRNAG